MRRLFTTLAAFAAVVALSGVMSAQTATTAKKATGSQTTSQKKAEASYTGTIEKYDANDKVLTLKRKTSDLQFEMASDCTITEGTTKLMASDLSGLAGQPAKIYYSGAPGGKMEAHKIVIEKSKAEKTMAKKDSSKK